MIAKLKKQAGMFLISCLLVFSMPCVSWGEDVELQPSSMAFILENMERPSGDFLVWEPEESVNLLSGRQVDQLYNSMLSYEQKEETLLINRSPYYYYYEQLDPMEKEMYDVMLEVARDPVSEGNYGMMMSTVDPLSDRFTNSYFRAYRAMTFDHPELFWLYNYSEGWVVPLTDGEGTNGRYIVFFGMEEPFREFETQMKAFNEAVESFLSDIDRSGSEYSRDRCFAGEPGRGYRVC